MGELIRGKKPLAEGKTKIIYPHEDEDKVILLFKNDITALDGLKRDVIPGKGYINAYITKHLFQLLEESSIPTQFVEYIFPNIVVAKKIQMLPVEVVCRNIAAGHLIKSFPMLKNGQELKMPIIEFFYKCDELHDPLMNEYHLQILDLASYNEITQIKEYTLKANRVLREFFKSRGLIFVDFKIEFGRVRQDQVVIGDELNGDSMRLWASPNGKEAFDKDGYRGGDSLETVRRTYIETFKIITGEEPVEEGLES